MKADERGHSRNDGCGSGYHSMSPSQGWRRGAILILVPAIAIIVNLILAKRVSLRDSHSLASMAFAPALNTEYRLASVQNETRLNDRGSNSSGDIVAENSQVIHVVEDLPRKKEPAESLKRLNTLVFCIPTIGGMIRLAGWFLF